VYYKNLQKGHCDLSDLSRRTLVERPSTRSRLVVVTSAFLTDTDNLRHTHAVVKYPDSTVLSSYSWVDLPYLLVGIHICECLLYRDKSKKSPVNYLWLPVFQVVL